MKKVFIAVIAISFVACESKEKGISPGNTDSTGRDTSTAINQPALDTKGYTLTYPATYAIGPNKNAEAILSLWRAWEENKLDMVKEIFADSVSLYFADGHLLTGKRDSVISSSQKARNTMGTIKSTIHAITSLSSSMGDDYVNVWGAETRTNNGKTDSVNIHEVWMFNKEGKASTLFQYEAKPTRN